MRSILLFHLFAFCFFTLPLISNSNLAYADTLNPTAPSLSQSSSLTAPLALKKCISDKYQHYTQTSINWYESLTQATIEKNPSLREVAHLFLDTRKKYVAFNQAVFSYYLNHSPETLDLSAPVESWLNIDQEQLKNISESNTELTPLAKEIDAFREKNRYKNNYKLRTALAELLSRPANMQAALNTYNQQIKAINQNACDKQS